MPRRPTLATLEGFDTPLLESRPPTFLPFFPTACRLDVSEGAIEVGEVVVAVRLRLRACGAVTAGPRLTIVMQPGL